MFTRMLYFRGPNYEDEYVVFTEEDEGDVPSLDYVRPGFELKLVAHLDETDVTHGYLSVLPTEDELWKRS